MLECTINFQLSMMIYYTERYNVESGTFLTITLKKWTLTNHMWSGFNIKEPAKVLFQQNENKNTSQCEKNEVFLSWWMK